MPACTAISWELLSVRLTGMRSPATGWKSSQKGNSLLGGAVTQCHPVKAVYLPITLKDTNIYGTLPIQRNRSSSSCQTKLLQGSGVPPWTEYGHSGMVR